MTMAKHIRYGFEWIALRHHASGETMAEDVRAFARHLKPGSANVSPNDL
jgi:hypothetical protein